MSKSQNQKTPFQHLIEELGPLIQYNTPVKQRPVLEVLLRKAIGVTITYSIVPPEKVKALQLSPSSIFVEFHFDEGYPIEVMLDTGDTGKEMFNLILGHTASRMYTALNDGSVVPMRNIMEPDADVKSFFIVHDVIELYNDTKGSHEGLIMKANVGHFNEVDEEVRLPS